MIEEGNGREIQNSVTEDPRLRTVTVADGGTGFSSSQARESNNSLKVEETTPGQPKKIETLTPVEQPERSQRSLAYAQHLIQEAYHARDPDAPASSKAAARVRLAKRWVDSILNPPPLPAIDRWLGKKETRYSDEEIDSARVVQVRALALEAALPAWKASTVARKAAQLTREPKVEEEAQAATDCWPFWRKAPAPPVDLHADALKKAKTATAAWTQAQTDFRSQKKSLIPENIQRDEASVSASDLRTNQSNNKLADAWANAFHHLHYMNAASGLSVETLQAQQKVEAALQAYEERKQEDPNDVTDAINELAKRCSELIESKKSEAQPQFQENWDVESKQLSYVIAVYEAQLASTQFDHAWDAFQTTSTEQDGASTGSSQDLLKQAKSAGATALQKWDKAITAKYKTLPEESRKRVFESLNPPSAADEPLTVATVALNSKEEAAKKRILEFQGEHEIIQKALDSLVNVAEGI